MKNKNVVRRFLCFVLMLAGFASANAQSGVKQKPLEKSLLWEISGKGLVNPTSMAPFT